MDCIYHGCFPKNTDGMNKIIAKGDKCLVPTNKCFWKDPSDVKNRVETRSQTENKPTVDYKTIDGYCVKRKWIDRWVLGKKQNNN